MQIDRISPISKHLLNFGKKTVNDLSIQIISFGYENEIKNKSSDDSFNISSNNHENTSYIEIDKMKVCNKK